MNNIITLIFLWIHEFYTPTFSDTSLVILSYHELFLREFWYFLRELACTLLKNDGFAPTADEKICVHLNYEKNIMFLLYTLLRVVAQPHE